MIARLSLHETSITLHFPTAIEIRRCATDAVMMPRPESSGSTLSSTVAARETRRLFHDQAVARFTMSQNRLPRAIDMPVEWVNVIVRGRRRISRDTAARLAYSSARPPMYG
jgi:hypothetical protein